MRLGDRQVGFVALGVDWTKARITHKVAIVAPGDIDLQVRRWLKQAYERDG